MATFQTPPFAGDYTAPSILRVARDFYLTHTSYRYSPDLPAWHSRDLANWTHISGALPRLIGEQKKVSRVGNFLKSGKPKVLVGAPEPDLAQRLLSLEKRRGESSNAR